MFLCAGYDKAVSDSETCQLGSQGVQNTTYGEGMLMPLFSAQTAYQGSRKDNLGLEDVFRGCH
jgi:hypothetical protein